MTPQCFQMMYQVEQWCVWVTWCSSSTYGFFLMYTHNHIYLSNTRYITFSCPKLWPKHIKCTSNSDKLFHIILPVPAGGVRCGFWAFPIDQSARLSEHLQFPILFIPHSPLLHPNSLLPDLQLQHWSAQLLPGKYTITCAMSLCKFLLFQCSS